MIPFQFLFFHSCNPISILIFPYLRKAYAFLYILSSLYGIFPYPYFTVFFTWLSNALSTFETIGFESFYRVSFPWLLLWLVSLIHYIEGERKAKYKLCILFLYTFFAPYLNPFGEIYIIDVGQGDCTLISLPYGQGRNASLLWGVSIKIFRRILLWSSFVCVVFEKLIRYYYP